MYFMNKIFYGIKQPIVNRVYLLIQKYDRVFINQYKIL